MDIFGGPGDGHIAVIALVLPLIAALTVVILRLAGVL
jgi:hypothetical protein